VIDGLLTAERYTHANWLDGAVKLADSQYLNARTAFTYPGSFAPNTTQKLLLRAATTVEDWESWLKRTSSATQSYAAPGAEPNPTFVAKILQSRPGTATTGWVTSMLRTTSSGQVAQRLATWGNNVFGRPWVNPATGLVEHGRGGGNLLAMANKSGVRSMVASAGALRVLGVAGSAFATVDGGVGLWNNHEKNAETWSEGGTEGKAHVIGEYAQVAFNASMTAALICPTPLTLGIVAVVGVVCLGAAVVEHWDDITGAVSDAADWAGDRAQEAGKWAGDQLDAVKDSDLNPMNWF